MANRNNSEDRPTPDPADEKINYLRQLPSIESVLAENGALALEQKYGRPLVVQSVREVVQKYRRDILQKGSSIPSRKNIVDESERRLRSLFTPTLYPVINASGVVIHTNLGRAPLSKAAASSVTEIASSYSNLEYDVEAGGRGSRSTHAEELLVRLTGAEAAMVVNNNAAAVLLVLTALCHNREVIISRSQLVEIGGGFRIPDVMVQSGARLIEVGTTNRTHIGDYAKAITDQTAAFFVAHHSNFKIVGFTAEPLLSEIAGLAKDHNVYSLYDQGSGAILDTAKFGMESEPTIGAGFNAGMDIITFSGDKLLGGPQAGIICGSRHLIRELKEHPLARAVRIDKMALAALSATLMPFLTGSAEAEIPVWQMIAQPLSEIKARVTRWQIFLTQENIQSEIIEGFSAVGGGSLPGTTIDTYLLAIQNKKVEALASSLRTANPPVISRIADGMLLLDPRTVMKFQEETLLRGIVASMKQLLSQSG